MELVKSKYCLFQKSVLASVLFICLFLCFALKTFSQNDFRKTVSLDIGWKTIADDKNKSAFDGFENVIYNDKNWIAVDVPHNWDAYEGYRRMRHGNRHGYAWYRKTFQVADQPTDKCYFLFFEGVGSYATVWLNGKKVGYHAGGRTTFTLDVTNEILLNNKTNTLAVRADHPANIQDLPWVCGGCSDERGFSEGSQPMGIFRPVQLVVTSPVRIEPFGVHIWNDSTITDKNARVFTETEVKNYSNNNRNVTVINRLVDKKGNIVYKDQKSKQIVSNEVAHIKGESPIINNPHLWSVEDPYLYQLVTEVVENGKIVDRLTTPYGIRWISWPIRKNKSSNQFLLNGKPVFINGIAEYEHLIGKSHAFSSEQIHTRVMQMKAGGFNAFRDAHQPHNLRYHDYWDNLGLLWWTQIAAHVWYDTPEFRNNFKKLLVEWVKERRNSPSIVLWGLQNESKLPEDFAKECTELIRQLDPTASSQRLVVTCNGGSGTDWDVPQNWTGTYGGNPATYGEDLKRQTLVGEYGAWRTLDLHTEGSFVQNGSFSEDRMTQLMELKVRLADSVKNNTTGHFMWLHTSHDNPGRVQGGEGYRELDRIGPVNYKGLLTPWEEPLDVYYMYRSNFAPKDKEPMVYIVSHTWPNRWIKPGKKDSIIVYSNCDEVELFNDVNQRSLGKRRRGGVGTHIQWDNVDIAYNVLYAIGYVNGKEVARDYIVLDHLPKAPNFNLFYKNAKPITAPQTGYNYLYRVNCGGNDYTDKQGNKWIADRQKKDDHTWGSVSWTNDFPGIPFFFASQRKTNDPIKGTEDWKLFQTFRYGREKLGYQFPVPDGEYLVELYFIEPWLGTGGGMDCTAWRLFDVAVNGKKVLKDIDIWKEAGHDAALKKTIKATVSGGQLIISFPKIASGQAVLSAIAIATKNSKTKPAPPSATLVQNFTVVDKSTSKNWSVQQWLETGEQQYENDSVLFRSIPSELFSAEWIRTPKSVTNTTSLAQFTVMADAFVYIGLDARIKQKPTWLNDYEDTKTLIENDFGEGQSFAVYRKKFDKNAIVTLGANGTIDGAEAAMYTVAVAATSGIEPAYDLKPIANYKAINGRLQGAGLVKGQVDGKDRVIFSKAGVDNKMEWDITVGVADTYSFTISYNNPHTKTLEGKLALYAADGTLMKEENVEFTTTRPGKSNYINSSSGTMINAGHYKISLSSKEAEGLSINSLDVQ